jgi:hypothetical protein
MGKSPGHWAPKCAKAPEVKFEFGLRGLVPLAPAETGERKYLAPWGAGPYGLVQMYFNNCV